MELEVLDSYLVESGGELEEHYRLIEEKVREASLDDKKFKIIVEEIN